MEALLLTEDL